MLIPWSTDAPIYHFPWATIGLIVVNTVIYFLTAGDQKALNDWMLVFGDGLHPLQWLSTNFLHANFMHLLGNMVFLWSFGLVVEGKLGWLPFLRLYCGIGVLYGLIIQLAMLGSAGAPLPLPATEPGAEAVFALPGAVGASGAIYGLMAICMIWAPSNEFSCVLLLGRVTMLELPIATFALLYIGMQFVFAIFDHFAMGSAILHLTGAAIGAMAGFVMLRRGMVDCEGWDLINVLQHRQHERPEEHEADHEEPADDKPTASQAPEPRRPTPAEQLAAGLQQIRVYLNDGNATAALKLSEKLASGQAEWRLPEAELLAAIRLLHREKQWAASIPAIVEYLKRFPGKSPSLQLTLAQILLLDQKRPFRALAVLGKLAAEGLTAEQAALRQKLLAQAEREAEHADLELQEDNDF